MGNDETRRTTPPAPRNALKGKLVARALASLAWDDLETHLSEVDVDAEALAELFGHVRRDNGLLLRWPDAGKEAARATFLRALRGFLATRLGSDAAALLDAETQAIERIEAGYREILRTLDGTVAAKLPPETQAAAALHRAAWSFRELTDSVISDGRRRKALTLQSYRVRRSDGSSFSPDGVLAGIVDVAGMTLKLLARRHGWFGPDGLLILPDLPEATDEEVYKAGLTEALASSWRNWERMEQRCRYFGGALRHATSPNLPDWCPPNADGAMVYGHVGAAELYDHMANHRLNDRMVQTFQEMALRTDMAAMGSGIAARVGLPPDAFVSAEEAHSIVSLSEILGYSVVDDEERPGGLRLVEWLRGYATLRCLARERYALAGKDGVCIALPRAALVGQLDRVGLANGLAERFVDLACLRSSSRDLFDAPLIMKGDGSLLLFGPGVVDADPARVTLSSIGGWRLQLGRKGKAFEREMARFLVEQGFDARSFRFKSNGEQYEYDVVFPWGDLVFLLECKNRTLSGHNPVAAYHFAEEISSAVGQARRLADAMTAHPDIVRKRAGIEMEGKTVIPCVVNSMPYARDGDEDGVFVTDASSLRRFFQERHLHVVRPHYVRAKHAHILHRIAVEAIWRGEKPTSTDFLAYLKDPVQLRLVAAHTEARHHFFGLGGRTVAAVADLAHTEMSSASVARAFSADGAWVEREAKGVTRAIRAAAARHEGRSVRLADRAWRSHRGGR